MPEAAGAPVRTGAAERNRIVRGGRFGGSVVAFLVAVSLAGAARAGVPIDPGDAIALPPGSTVAAGYYQFITADGYQLDLPGAGLITAGTHLNEQLGILRLIRYASLGGVEIAPQLILPYGSLYGGAIGGVPLPGATGFADPILGLTEWLVNDHRHRRYVTATEYLTLPAGSYEPGRTLNLGGNRWVGDFQLGYHQGLGPRVALGFALDATFYGDNSRAGDGRQTLTEADAAAAMAGILAEHPRLASFEGLSGQTFYHCPDLLSRTYARILDRKGSPLLLMAEEIRANSRDYPRPVPVELFEAPPFDLTPEEIEHTLRVMAADPKYHDISFTPTSTGTVYLFSTLHLDRGYAAFLAQRDEALAMNP